jgi:hypothetical protein
VKLKTTDEIMGALERGELSKDFADAVRKCCEALIAAEEGKASVTLKISFSAKQEVCSIKSNVTTSLPEKKRRSTTLFLTDDGHLSQEHPDQIGMFDGGDRKPIRTINHADG